MMTSLRPIQQLNAMIMCISIIVVPSVLAATLDMPPIVRTIQPIEFTPIIRDFTPVVIYYVVDTPEPYMQLALDYEIKAFEKSCNRERAANWVLFINSYFTQNDGEVIYCRNGLRHVVKLATAAPAVYQEIQDKIALLADHAVPPKVLAASMLFPVALTDQNMAYRNLYKTYPLANVDVFYHLKRWTEQLDLFPTGQYLPVVHFKAHAARAHERAMNLLLTGMTNAALNEKIKEQEAHRNKIVNQPKFVVALPKISYGQAGRNKLSVSETILDQIGLAKVPTDSEAMTSADGKSKPGLGAYGLGAYGLGAYGLGAYGLVAQGFFGANAYAMQAAFDKLANETPDGAATKGDEPRLGFALFEACEANINSSAGMRLFATAGNRSIHALYAPSGFLWYRNLNWDEILSDKAARSSGKQLVKILSHSTGKIKNYFEPSKGSENTK